MVSIRVKARVMVRFWFRDRIWLRIITRVKASVRVSFRARARAGIGIGLVFVIELGLKLGLW
jgi:hypothetical protein